MSDTSIEHTIVTIAQQAREASLKLAPLGADAKNKALVALKGLIEANVERIVEENKKDLIAGQENQLSAALLDRLELTPKRIAEF